MARTKAFDVNVALDRAMQTFWSHGYAATSAQDLVDVMEINRSSLYSTFGSKRELFQRALDRYGGTDQPWMERLLDGTVEFRPRLRAALLEAVEEDLDPWRSRGCFACNAAVELGPSDARVRQLVSGAFAKVAESFREALLQAREDGEVSADADVDALAGFLVCALEGLHVVAKGTRDRRLVERAVTTIVAAV